MKSQKPRVQEQKINPWNSGQIQLLNQPSFGLLSSICQTQNSVINMPNNSQEKQLNEMINTIKLGEKVRKAKFLREYFTILHKYKGLIQMDSINNKNKILKDFLTVLKTVNEISEHCSKEKMNFDSHHSGNYFSISYQMRQKFFFLLKDILNEGTFEMMDLINISKYYENIEDFESLFGEKQMKIGEMKQFLEYVQK